MGHDFRSVTSVRGRMSQSKAAFAVIRVHRYLFQCGFFIRSSVARIVCEDGRESKMNEFKGDTQKYYEIHAMNSDSDKAIDLHVLF